LAVRQDFDRSLIEPILIGDAKLKGEPVRKIDEGLVLDHSAGNIGAHSIVAAREINPWIVNTVYDSARRCPASRKITVPQGAQGFADSLARRFEPFEH
jgi:hypothetical protein